MFYSVYDLIEYYTRKLGMNLHDVQKYFAQHRYPKSILDDLKETRDLDAYEGLLPLVLDLVKMSELAFNLALGKIPSAYRDTYLGNLHIISKQLDLINDNKPQKQMLDSPFFQTRLGTLYNSDCIRLLKSLPSKSVDLIFADPPFNIKKEYDSGVTDNLSKTDYIVWCHAWLDECIRILKPGGSLFVYNLPKWCVYIAEYLNRYLTFRQWIAIDMKVSLPLNGRLNPCHYGLLYYIKGPKANTFNNQRMPMQTCRHCGGEIKDYGGYKSKMNPAGINISDVWTDIYPVRHKSSKNRTFNELSVKFLDRVISMSSNPNDLILDPFGGSGTTYVVAELLGRKWIGTEIGNCDVIARRFGDLSQDMKLLNEATVEKSSLFSKRTKALRKSNGFWLDEDYSSR